ncbi:MAG: T9SS type A sorting domain-containing protein [Arcicella sp.]|nr:T9SS type A sorting domain-containing protein [Arcicella sp.]
MKKLFILLCIFLSASVSDAQYVFQFDFAGYGDNVPPPITASSGNATLTQNGISNFSNDMCSGTGFSANSWNTGDYIQIQTSTVGFVGPFTLSFDYRMSNIGLGNFEIQVSTNGAVFTPLTNINAVNPTSGCSALPNQTLSNAYDNQSTLYIRITKTNDAVTALNRFRLDRIYLQATALPVQLTYFQTETTDNQKVNIRWETAQEINSNVFVLERSRNAIDYKTIATLEAAGESKTIKKYSFTDDSALFGTNYYRLSQVDKDGAAQVFRPQAVIIDDASLPFGVFANPVFSKTFNVKVEDADEANFVMNDLNGKSISLKTNKLTQTIVEITPTENLSLGMYILQVQTLGSLKMHKVLVVK